ncbi:unnamed protein product, partial [Effrenium voratum]
GCASAIEVTPLAQWELEGISDFNLEAARCTTSRRNPKSFQTSKYLTQRIPEICEVDVSDPDDLIDEGRDREGKFYHRALSAVGSETSPRGKHGAPVPAGINAIPFFVWVASALLFALFAQLAILIVIGPFQDILPCVLFFAEAGALEKGTPDWPPAPSTYSTSHMSVRGRVW